MREIENELTKELAKVMTIIIRRVLLSMIAWSQDSHLMSINRVVIEKMASLFVDLPWAVFIAPKMLRELSKSS